MARYDRYGLSDNPFKPFNVEPYRPPRVPPDRELSTAHLEAVDGFSKVLGAEVDACLSQCLPVGNSPVFVVIGPRGVGRSSAARAILDKFRRACGADANNEPTVAEERFLVPDPGELNDDPYAVYQSWLLSLNFALRELGGVPYDTVRDLIRGTIYDTQLNNLVPQYADCLWEVRQMLKGANPPARFGVCLENVSNYKLVSAGAQIFKRAATVCVFTVLDNDAGKLIAEDARKANYQVLQLSPLSGCDVVKVVDKYWSLAAKTPNPIDSSALEETLGKQNPPVGRVLGFTAALMQNKARGLGDGPKWPHDPTLEISKADVEGFLSDLRLGGYVPSEGG